MMLGREPYRKDTNRRKMRGCDGNLLRDTILLSSIVIIMIFVVWMVSAGLRTDIDCPLTPNCVYINTFNQDYDIYVGDKYICSAIVGYIPVNDTSCYLKIEDDDNWCNVSMKCDNFSRKLLKAALLILFGCLPGIVVMYVTVKITIRWWDWNHYNKIYEQEIQTGNDVDKELLEATWDE